MVEALVKDHLKTTYILTQSLVFAGIDSVDQSQTCPERVTALLTMLKDT